MTTNRNIEKDIRSTRQILELLRSLQESGDTNWLGHDLDSGAARIDQLLMCGARMEDIELQRAAVQQHVRHLKVEHGLKVVEVDGRLAFDHTDESNEPTP